MSNKLKNLGIWELDELLESTLATPQNLDKIKAIKCELKQRKESVKLTVAKFEKTNHNYLVVFASTNRFCKMIGHSVLFYSQHLASRIHRKPNICADRDFYAQSKDGVISINDPAGFIMELGKIGLYPDEKLSTADINYFKLDHTYSDQDIHRMRNRSQKTLEDISRTITQVSPIPELHLATQELVKVVYYKSNRSTPFAQHTILAKLMDFALSANNRYLDYAHRNGQPIDLLKRIDQNTFMVQKILDSILQIGLLERSDIAEILKVTVKIRRLVNKELESHQKNA